jgi:predicted metalloprotease
MILLAILSFIFGEDFLALVDQGAPVSPVDTAQRDAAEEPAVEFVSFVLDDAQQTWHRIFPSLGADYQDARLVLFREAVQSGCGVAGAETGPFYCPADQKVYIDLSFFDELRSRFRAPGEFAQAYVLAHEIGHHVQTLLGVDRQVRRAQQTNPGSANAYSVRMELQADCLAGVWGHSTAQRDILEKGDVEDGLNAAAAIGDDRIQRMAGRNVNAESFTHGSSQQRVAWFRRGLQTGQVSACDTFSTSMPR